MTATRLTREIRERVTSVKRYLAAVRPENAPKPFEVRFDLGLGFMAGGEDVVLTNRVVPAMFLLLRASELAALRARAAKFTVPS